MFCILIFLLLVIYFLTFAINLTIEIISSKKYVDLITTVPLYAIAIYIFYSMVTHWNEIIYMH